MVGWYGGSEEYVLISSLRFSRETFHEQRLQAPISVTPEHHRFVPVPTCTVTTFTSSYQAYYSTRRAGHVNFVDSLYVDA